MLQSALIGKAQDAHSVFSTSEILKYSAVKDAVFKAHEMAPGDLTKHFNRCVLHWGTDDFPVWKVSSASEEALDSLKPEMEKCSCF